MKLGVLKSPSKQQGSKMQDMGKPGEAKQQIDKFRDAARELETDQSEEAFDRIVKGIAKAPPPKSDEKNRS